MTPKLQIGVVIPAFQAAGTVGAVVRDALHEVERVVVVDDGSTDGTGSAGASAGAEVLSHPQNRGKGAALRTGMRHLFGQGCTYVATLDADGQHLARELRKLAARVPECPDLVLGCRDHLFREMGPLRRLSNSASSRWISRVAGCAIPDVQTGFRLYARRLFEELDLPEPGFEAESAVVVRAARRRFLLESVPVEMNVVDGRATSHYRPLRDSWRIVRAVLAASREVGP